MKLAIFIPGLQLEPKEPNLEKYAIRLKKALNINDPIRANKYEMKMTKEKFGHNDKEEVDVATIKLISPSGEMDYYKIYKFNYASLLTGEFEQKSVFYKCIYLVWTMVTGTIRFLKPLFSKKKTLSRRYQLQALYVFAILMIISLFVVSLLPSAITLLFDKLPSIRPHLNDLGLGKIVQKMVDWGFTRKRFEHLSKILLSFSTLFYLFLPKLKTMISILATEYLCLDSYLNYADGNPLITGKFDTLLEYIAELYPQIDGIEFHAYSFGSIITYDVLFPFGREPSERIQQMVKRLITIGSPHDFIKNYYPFYFKDRGYYPMALNCWYNVYSQSDILSSNFRFDSKAGLAEFSIVEGGLRPQNIKFDFIQPEVLGKFDTLRLYILKIHSGYWDSNEDATSCLTSVIKEINRNPDCIQTASNNRPLIAGDVVIVH